VANPPALDADSGTLVYILTIEVTDNNETVQENLTINVNPVGVTRCHSAHVVIVDGGQCNYGLSIVYIKVTFYGSLVYN
jgi:hypothetical protein